jgi:hypothetical protein
MPSTRCDALPDQAPVRLWVKRIGSLVPPLIAQPTSRRNVVSLIRAAVTTSIKMLGGALQQASLRSGNPELPTEWFRV